MYFVINLNFVSAQSHTTTRQQIYMYFLLFLMKFCLFLYPFLLSCVPT